MIIRLIAGNNFDFPVRFLGETTKNDATTESNAVERHSNDVAPIEHAAEEQLNASTQSGNLLLQHHTSIGTLHFLPFCHLNVKFVLMQKFY